MTKSGSYLYGHDLLEDNDWPLRCAQAMALLPVPDTRTSGSLVNVLHSSFETVMRMISPLTPLAPLLDGLKNLPCELQGLVFSFMLDSPGGCALFNEDTLVVLEKLRAWPERSHRSILCEGALFAHWDGVGQMSYLAGLYDRDIPGSTQIKQVCLFPVSNPLKNTAGVYFGVAPIPYYG
ncbi:hypothetical protein DDE82_008968 [Stemphylium lycopersici]|uniref:Uncharacterized protein n=1 Tax=Stemphylium lycopersici TaxID=183478 RepID=A0A364MS62_STELY|nr:hypothetical protein TW65_08415 [Stemphylium lycopersici]RAQ98725.1 hypothetical protein DDE82_008968 [Stemphylium lycopersici]RAR00949.1 hypothetical protein DDE83_009016 [Stemphylium lycopersici]